VEKTTYREALDLYSSPNIIRVIKYTKEVSKTCSKYGERRRAYTVFVGRPEGKRQFGRPKRKWEDTIKVDLQEE
jgi:hypothetical protein